MHSGVRCINRREAIIHADVIHNDCQIVRADNPFDQTFQAGSFSFCNSQLGSRWRFKGNYELAGIGLGKVRESELGVENQAGRECQKTNRQDGYGDRQNPLDQGFVSPQHSIESPIECGIESASPARLTGLQLARLAGLGLAEMFGILQFQVSRTEQRYNGHSDHIRTQKEKLLPLTPSLKTEIYS